MRVFKSSTCSEIKLADTWDESVVLEEEKILHHFRQAFWYGKGVRYQQKIIQNRDMAGF